VTLGPRVNDLLVRLIGLERRVDPYFRPAFDRVFQRPIATMVQAAINRRRRHDPPLALAEERRLPDEDEIAGGITATMAEFTRRTYANALPAQRAGNTKTHGVLRAEFEILPDLPAPLSHGLFATPATYRAWIRFAGPGPLAPPDIKDNGLLSIGIKVCGVGGAKLLDDEHATQDFTGISSPTFTTPNIIENLQLQHHILRGTPIFYFLGPRHSHLLDGIMQGLYTKTQLNPLDERYWSCAAYLLGAGQAMHYSVVPRHRGHTKFPRHPSDNYLREAMAERLKESDAEFDFCVQRQTDPHRMPVEHDGVEWPERRSPFVPVARLRIPRQRFDTADQMAFAHNLTYNPWHCLPEHRPLGNQNRARRYIYRELATVRQSMNGTPHIEPTGNETFE
jgi:hypothetical protein